MEGCMDKPVGRMHVVASWKDARTSQLEGCM